MGANEYIMHGHVYPTIIGYKKSIYTLFVPGVDQNIICIKWFTCHYRNVSKRCRRRCRCRLLKFWTSRVGRGDRCHWSGDGTPRRPTRCSAGPDASVLGASHHGSGSSRVCARSIVTFTNYNIPLHVVYSRMLLHVHRIYYNMPERLFKWWDFPPSFMVWRSATAIHYLKNKCMKVNFQRVNLLNIFVLKFWQICTFLHILQALYIV